MDKTSWLDLDEMSVNQLQEVFTENARISNPSPMVLRQKALGNRRDALMEWRIVIAPFLNLREAQSDSDV